MSGAAGVALLVLLCAGFGAPAWAGDLAEAELAYFRGLAALGDGELAAAVEQFEAAVGFDPEHGPALYMLGLTAARLGDRERAAEALAAALDADRPPGVPLAEIEARLDELRRGDPLPLVIAAPGGILAIPGQPRLDGRLSLWLAEDSNPGSVPDGQTAVLPGGETLDGPTSDTVGDLRLRLGYRLWPALPADGESRWRLGVVFLGRQELYGDLDFLALGQARAVAQLSWGGDPLGYLFGPLEAAPVARSSERVSALLQVATDYRWRDGESFLRSDAVAASLVVRPGRTTATQLDAELRRVSTFAAGGLEPERSGDELEVGLSQWFYFGLRNRSLRLGAFAGERRAGPAFDSDWLGGRAELSLPFGRNWLLYLGGTVTREQFDDLASNPAPIFLVDEPLEQRRSTLDAHLIWTPATAGAGPARWRLSARVVHQRRELDLGPSTVGLGDFDSERTVGLVALHWYFSAGASSRSQR